MSFSLHWISPYYVLLLAACYHYPSPCRAFGGFGLGMGGGGMKKYLGPPLGPVVLPPANGSTWGDVLEETLQQALDHCKSVRMCNTSGLFSFADSECSECHPCSCDEACHERRDCCLDRQLREVVERPVLEPPAAPSQTPNSPVEGTGVDTGTGQRRVYGCHDTYVTHYDLGLHAFMVDTCRDGWREEVVKDRCLHPSPNGTFSRWPVWSRDTDRVYRNSDCARCNGEGGSGSGVVRWNLKVACDRSVYVRHSGDVVEALEKALEEPTCQILFVPPAGCRPVPCRPVTGRYINRCNVTGQRHSYDQTLWRACRLFHGGMTLAGNTYKNVFCAMCNHDRMRVPGACHVDPPFPFFLEVEGASFYVQSDHQTAAQSPCRCKESEIYDKFDDRCRPLHCSMTRELRHGHCQSVVTNSSGVFYDLALSLSPSPADSADRPPPPVQVRGAAPLTRAARNIRTAFLLQGSHITGWHVMTHRFRVVAETEEVKGGSVSSLLQVLRFKVHIKFCSTWPEPSQSLEDRLFAMLESEWTFSVDGGAKRTFQASPLYIDESEEEVVTGDAKTFHRASLLSSEGRFKEFMVDIPDAYIESHGGDLLETNYYLPVSEALKCPKVSFNLSQGAESGKPVLVLNKTSGTLHHLPSNKFISFQFVEVGKDGEVLVCADKLFDGSSRESRRDFPVDLFSSQLFLVTIVFQALSLFFLLLVLLTFLVFAELRTTAGKSLLGLVSSLVVAVALTGGSLFGVGTLLWCRVLGLVGHFFLLSAFAWALCCSFHSFLMISGSKLGSSRETRGLDAHGIFHKYFLASLLVSVFFVVIIIVCSVVDSQEDCVTDFGYGRGICFISTYTGFIITACLSVAVVVTSVGLSIWVALLLRRRRHRGAAAVSGNRSVESSSRQHPHSLTAHTFLAGLMTGAWLLKMVALLEKKAALWYLSLLLYLALSIYIFVVFTCRKHVRKLWCARLTASFASGKGLRKGHKFSPVDT
ncbi:uncharacterized protein LOC143286214 [Babylonia areolata]|uniref:uncharacterized protein LOC143286214 n=1 Tax=Babylonia areolata TaxID=304850 RepID=UPI003FD67276